MRDGRVWYKRGCPTDCSCRDCRGRREAGRHPTFSKRRIQAFVSSSFAFAAILAIQIVMRTAIIVTTTA